MAIKTSSNRTAPIVASKIAPIILITTSLPRTEPILYRCHRVFKCKAYHRQFDPGTVATRGEPKLQLVKDGLRVLVFRQLIDQGQGALLAPQLIGLGAVKQGSGSAIGPGQPPLARKGSG
jgi:hypothetical protein